MTNLRRVLENLNRTATRNLIAAASIDQQLGRQLAAFNRSNLILNMPRIYDSAFQALDDPFLRRALNVSNEIQKIAQSASLLHATHFQEIAQATQNLDLFSRKMSADLAAFRLTFQHISASNIFENLFRILQQSEDAAEAFKSAGWPIAPSMPRSLREKVIKMHAQGQTSYASQSIIGYYRRNHHEHLTNAVSKWVNNHLFAPRMRIINAALEAHCDGKYILSIPTLFPLIEGICNDY